ncbi:hypothetical protein sscle_09g071140 [Sclerotinia sclerotiorum 1980 UF-70]|uniref:Uncharacterized protein n=1 Tax=Sclerotinia sclerotiorum (strain ATCC 18683 / 1980 / Ss-1) TaxID=665079 RepID=A0A1D9QBL3_SCLS1|nr:hypothetical protein sscle_09g071140 [Sclerotinia sclerotiorum 1980 UF-70]
MYVLSRKLVTQGSRPIAEEYSIVGAHGNLHKVTIANEPRCDCCKGTYGLPCWHVLFILKKILKVPEPLCYQFVLLDVELEWMLTRDIPDNYCQRRSVNEQELCYICQEDLSTNENILTWCKTQCGVNFHRNCVLEWAATKWEDENFPRGQSNIHCAVCRQPWVFTGEELLEAIRTDQNGHIYKGVGGYTNVAKIFGMKELPMSEEGFAELKLELFLEGDEVLMSTLRQMSEAESQVYRRHVLEVDGDRIQCVMIQQLRRKDESDA